MRLKETETIGHNWISPKVLATHAGFSIHGSETTMCFRSSRVDVVFVVMPKEHEHVFVCDIV